MKNTYPAVIPAVVRYDKDLSSSAKLLYGEISALSIRCGYCCETNGYFANLFGVCGGTISRWISQLSEKEYIKSVIVYHKGTKQIKERKLYP